MTTDLARTLHDVVDGAGTTSLLGHARSEQDAVGEIVGHLATRIRTRRAVRAGARAGVGLVAVGAIAAFGGQLVGRRGTDDLLPAAVPGAAPGTCGSSVADLVATGGDGLAVGLTGSAPYNESGSAVAGSEELGPLVGRDLDAYVTVRTVAGSTTTLPGFQIDHGITQVASVMTPNVVVAHGDTVVAVLVATRRETWAMGSPEGIGAVELQVAVPVVTCSTSQAPGGAPLPAGSYTLQPVVEYPDLTRPGGVSRLVGPSVPVTLLPEPALLSGLPSGFPTDVPIIGGRLLEAARLDGTTASGWTVTVAVDGADGVTRALDALGYWPEKAGSLGLLDEPTSDGRWLLRVQPGLTSDGEATVVYRITPS